MKKLLAILAALALTAAMTATVFASPLSDNTYSTEPAGGTATAQSDDGDTWKVSLDDDNVTSDADTATDIYVWAQVKDNGTKVYKVDITWGEMKFEYNSGTKWNVDEHKYTIVDGVTAGWQVAGYVNGTNNKITVTNHSNEAIDAAFAYAMNDTNPFNAASNDNNVVGNFFANNENAVAAAGVATVASIENKLSDNKITVASADNGTVDVPGTPQKGNVYFAFSGVPDSGKGADLADFTQVGVITVTICVNAE